MAKNKYNATSINKINADPAEMMVPIMSFNNLMMVQPRLMSVNNLMMVQTMSYLMVITVGIMVVDTTDGATYFFI